jgi:pimeloyl-ACP methyl ester carboxylesterase
MGYVVKCIELAPDLKLPYVEQGDASGVPLVLLHGFAGFWGSFKLVLPHLPESIHAFAPTQRGHGDASKPAHGYRVRDFASDVGAFMDALRLEAAVLVGGSSGGFAARRFAINHPERVRGLALLGCPATLRGKPRVEEMWESTISKLTDPVDPAFVREFVGGTVDPSVPQELVERIVQQSLKMPACAWRETNKELLEDDSLRELERIAMPTLIVWGDQDSISPRSEQEDLAARIPDSQLVVYRGAGHTFYLEEPERVAADLIAFIEDTIS